MIGALGWLAVLLSTTLVNAERKSQNSEYLYTEFPWLTCTFIHSYTEVTDWVLRLGESIHEIFF